MIALILSLAAVGWHTLETIKEAAVRPRFRPVDLLLPATVALNTFVATLLYPGPAGVHSGQHFLAAAPMAAHVAHPWPSVASTGAMFLLLATLWGWLRERLDYPTLAAATLVPLSLSPIAVSLAALDPVYLLLPLLFFVSLNRISRAWHHPRARDPLIAGLALLAAVALTAGLWHAAVVTGLFLVGSRALVALLRAGHLWRRYTTRIVSTPAAFLLGFALWISGAGESIALASSPRAQEFVRPAMLLLYTDGLVHGLTYPLVMGLLVFGGIWTVRHRSPAGALAALALLFLGATTLALGCWGSTGRGDAFALLTLFSAPLMLLLTLGVAEIAAEVRESRILRVSFLGVTGFLMVQYHIMHHMFY